MNNRSRRTTRNLPGSSPVLFFTTFSKQKDAEKFAQKILVKKLAACLNVTSNITSFYFWQGKLHRDKELLLIGKTTRSKFKEIKRLILKLHSYDLPELICV